MNWQRLWVVMGVLLAGWLLYRLGPVLSPFFAAAVLAYVFVPVIDHMESRVPRGMGVLIVSLVLLVVSLLVVMWLIPLVDSQIEVFRQNAPRYSAQLEAHFVRGSHAITKAIGVPLSPELLVQQLQEHMGSVGKWTAKAMGKVVDSGLAVVGWVVNLVLIPVIGFYLLRDWHRMMQALDTLLPRSIAPTARKLAHESDLVLGEFLRGQLLVMLALGIMYSVGLTLIGVNLAVPIGLFAGVISFVPYLGLIVGGGVATGLAAVQFQDIYHPLMVIGVFAIAQMIEGLLLTPWLVGDRIGVHPIGVIFAVMAGEELFGFAGMLLALPTAAVLTVWWRHLLTRYRESDFYTEEEPAPATPATVKADSS